MCGIAAYMGRGDHFRILVELLLELQHRGQEAAGIVLFDMEAKRFVRLAGSGVVGNLLLKDSARNISIESAQGRYYGGVGHVRYATTGGYWGAVIQPIIVNTGGLNFSLAFNGTIANYRLIADEIRVKASNDSRVLGYLISELSREYRGDIVEAARHLSEYVIGGYSLIVLTNEPRIIIARDPAGYRPLSYSLHGEDFYVASETAALEVIGAGEWSEVKPGEVISFDGFSLEKYMTGSVGTSYPCVFEYIYFSRPDSVFNGVSVYEARYRMGKELAGLINGIEVDMVVPVPDTGRIPALGLSETLGLHLEEAVIVNKYMGRGFITPPSHRSMVAKLKYNVVRNRVIGKRILLVEDSIVRGTTLNHLVSKLRYAGASKVNIGVVSPPFKYPCFMGIDIPAKNELIAGDLTPEEVARRLGADSVIYNTIEGLGKAVGSPSLCMACFTGRYAFRGLSLEDLENMVKR